MALPPLIEIIPPRVPLHARVSVPGSKSVTNRALILAALAGSMVELRGALWSEDTQVMVDGLRRLGFDVSVEKDPREICNRTIRVEGRGGVVPRAGTEKEPLELVRGQCRDCRPFSHRPGLFGEGVFRIEGGGRMGERLAAVPFQRATTIRVPNRF